MRIFRDSCFLLLLHIRIAAFSQDLIVTKDSVTIRCKIIRENNTSIFYKVLQRDIWVHESIEKSNVKRYFYTKEATTNTAQSKTPSSRVWPGINVSVAFGNAIPFGEFSRKSLADTTSGFAQKGTSYNIGLVLKLSPYFGFSAAYVSQVNNFDVKTAVNALQIKYGGSFSGTATPWRMNGFFGGLFFYVPVKTISGFFIEANIMLGYPVFTWAGTNIIQVYHGTMVAIAENSALANAFTWLPSFILRYRIMDHFYVTGSLDAFWAKPEFTNALVTIATTGGYKQYGLISTTQVEKSFSIKAGLVYTFGKNRNGLK